MAKKINEEHMAKMFGGFGLTCNAPTLPTKEDNGLESAIPTPIQEHKELDEQTKPNQEEIGSKPKPHKTTKTKTDRVSFMCRISESNLFKIRILSATSGKSLSDFIDSSITEYLINHEDEYGKILSRVQ